MKIYAESVTIFPNAGSSAHCDPPLRSVALQLLPIGGQSVRQAQDQALLHVGHMLSSAMTLQKILCVLLQVLGVEDL